MKSQATPFEKRLLLTILIPGVLGFITAANLAGIGPCGLAPITVPHIIQCLLVAVATVWLTVFCGDCRKAPAIVDTLPMLAPPCLPLWIASGMVAPPVGVPLCGRSLGRCVFPWTSTRLAGSTIKDPPGLPTYLLMNAKTWQTLCGLALYPFFLGAAVTFLQPGHPWLIPIVKFFNIFFVALCSLGACMGVLFCLRRLYLGCPFCRARSRVLGGSGKELWVDCPSCGRVVVTCRFFRTATAELVGDDDEEDVEEE